MKRFAKLTFRSRLPLCVLAAAFFVRALTPVGFMPAPLAEGGPFVLCHGTAAAQLLRSHGTHHSHEHAAHAGGIEPVSVDGAHEVWEHCPLGVAASVAALGGQGPQFTAQPATATAIAFSAAGPARRHLSPSRARGPPAPSVLS